MHSKRSNSNDEASYFCILLFRILRMRTRNNSKTRTTKQFAPWDLASPFFLEADTSTAVEAVSLSTHITPQPYGNHTA